MPIRRYVEEGVFTPQALSAMSKALEATAEILGIAGDEVKRRAVARFIIRLAQEDERPNCVTRPWRRWEASHTSPFPGPSASLVAKKPRARGISNEAKQRAWLGGKTKRAAST
jgi:hypothetical protein